MLIAAAAQSTSHCLQPHCFNLVESAGRLAQFAGVLTALTFTAVIFLTGREPGEHPGHTVILFLSAFLNLAIATYLFASAAAEELPDRRAVFEAFLASLVLSIAILHLFLGIAQLVHDRGFSEVEGFAVRLATWVVGPVIFVFMSLTAVDAAGLHEKEHLAWGSPLGIGCIVLAVTLVAFVVWGSPTDRTRKQITGARWSAFSIAVVVIACGLSAVWAERGIKASAPASVYLTLMALLSLSALGYSAQLKAIERTAVEPGQAPTDALPDDASVLAADQVIPTRTG